MHKTPAELVHETLGVRPLARQLNKSPATVQKWKKGDGIVPAKYYPRILELADGQIRPEELIFGRSE